MPQSIVFQNSGLIDIRAVKTFGVNVKETENPFGYFGTGLKYAIAILLRNRCEITLFRGLEEFKFALKETSIRGQEFSIITMNGEELGFTTELGKNWKLWQAYRELYCNTLDENGVVFVSSDHANCLTHQGETTIIISGHTFISVHNKRHEFILNSSPLEVIDNVEIHSGVGDGFFYKNIFVEGLREKEQSHYRYNILKDLDLTEDRTVKSLFSAEWEIVDALAQSRNKEIIHKTITAQTGFEENLHWSYTNKKPSSEFLEVVEEALKDSSVQVSLSASHLYTKYVAVKKPVATTLTSVQQIQLQKAKTFASSIGLFEDNKFPLVITESFGKGILGKVKDNTIYLSLECFEMGTKMVAGTLIEEYIHLNYSYDDMTRSMQNFLLNKIVSMGEDKMGEPL